MKKANSSAGYTLIELLTVLVILGITTGMIIFTITPNYQKQLERFADELSRAISLAQEQALLQATTLRLVLSPTTFHFAEPQEKTAISTQPTAALYQLPRGIAISFKEQTQLTHPPLVSISADGSFLPFSLVIRYPNKPGFCEIIGHADGTLAHPCYPHE